MKYRDGGNEAHFVLDAWRGWLHDLSPSTGKARTKHRRRPLAFCLLGMMLSICGYPFDSAFAQKSDIEELAESWNQKGLAYYRGEGVEQSHAQAVQLFAKAANAGNVEAMVNLGTQYQMGTGVARDEEVAAGWYRQAAERGHPIGQLNLGMLYHRGLGVPYSHQKAAELYRKAAAQGQNHAGELLKNLEADIQAEMNQEDEGATKCAAFDWRSDLGLDSGLYIQNRCEFGIVLAWCHVRNSTSAGCQYQDAQLGPLSVSGRMYYHDDAESKTMKKFACRSPKRPHSRADRSQGFEQVRWTCR